ncbi:hypothetical protein Vafri_2218 [Volvox africanus]|nr:hypothetical protein Vafri_2218 [Volvox africanus]
MKPSWRYSVSKWNSTSLASLTSYTRCTVTWSKETRGTSVWSAPHLAALAKKRYHTAGSIPPHYRSIAERDFYRRHLKVLESASGWSIQGLVGYSAYCPSKYAVKGLADSLRNELQGTQVKISFAQPPDTDTPGFAEENKHKPPETKEISEAGSTVFKPEQVAAVLMAGILRGDYLLPTPDLGLQVNIIATKGLLPRFFPGVLLDMFVGFIAPLVHWAVVGMFDRVARRTAGPRFAKLWGTGGEGRD